MVELIDVKNKTIKTENLAYVSREKPRIGPDDRTNDDDVIMVNYVYFVSDDDLAADSRRRKVENLKTQMTVREYKELLALMPEISQEIRTMSLEVLEVKCEKGTEYYADEDQLERLFKLSSGDNRFPLYLDGVYEQELYFKTSTGYSNGYDEEKRQKLYLELTNGDVLSDNPRYGAVKDIKKISGEVPYSIITLKYKNGLTKKLPSSESRFIDEVEEELEKFKIKELNAFEPQPVQSQQEPPISRPGLPSWLKRKEKVGEELLSDPLEEPTPMTEEEIALDKIRRAKNKKNRDIAIAIVLGGMVLSGIMMGVYGFVKKFGLKPEGEPTPSFTPTATATFAPTATPIPTPTIVPTETPSPTPNYNAGEEFLAQLKANGYKYILDGDIITFDKDIAANLFKFISNNGMDLFNGLDDNLKRESILEYQKAILFYCADTLDPTTSGPVYIGDSCNISDAEKELLAKVTDAARNIADLSVNQPINGKIIDSTDQIGKFDDEYVNAVKEFIVYEKNLKNNPVYASSNLRYKYLIRSIVTTAIKAYMPSYFYIENPEDGKKEYITSFKYTRSENEEYDYNPLITENGTRFSCEYDLDSKTGEPILFTYEEMMSYMDSTSVNYMQEMSMEGIAKEAFDKRNEIDQAIFAEAGVSVEKDIPPTK